MAQLASLYWVNFAKTVDPNGPGLPHWPAYSGSRDRKVMRFTAEPSSGVDPALSRYEVLDASYAQHRSSDPPRLAAPCRVAHRPGMTPLNLGHQSGDQWVHLGLT